jgi:hypothetical protein
MKKRFILLEQIGNASAEVVFAYPVFNSLEEGLEYIRDILDPYYTGHYGIADMENQPQ